MSRPPRRRVLAAPTHPARAAPTRCAWTHWRSRRPCRGVMHAPVAARVHRRPSFAVGGRPSHSGHHNQIDDAPGALSSGASSFLAPATAAPPSRRVAVTPRTPARPGTGDRRGRSAGRHLTTGTHTGPTRSRRAPPSATRKQTPGRLGRSSKGIAQPAAQAVIHPRAHGDFHDCGTSSFSCPAITRHAKVALWGVTGLSQTGQATRPENLLSGRVVVSGSCLRADASPPWRRERTRRERVHEREASVPPWRP